MRISRHSSESAAPVEMAISGRSPSLPFFGSRSMWSGMGLSWHCLMGKVNCLRHLPDWITSGTLVPSGAFGILKLPFASVTDVAQTVG